MIGLPLGDMVREGRCSTPSSARALICSSLVILVHSRTRAWEQERIKHVCLSECVCMHTYVCMYVQVNKNILYRRKLVNLVVYRTDLD